MSVDIHHQQSYTNSHIIRMAVPLMLSFLLEQLIGMTDVAFLGRVGEVELGAAALAGVFFLTVLMLGIGYAIGVQSYMSHRNGEKAYEKIGTAFRAGTVFLTGLSLALIVLTLIFSPLFLDAACESQEVADAAGEYLFWRVWGLPFAFVCGLYRGFFVATLKPGILTLSSFVMVLTNCVLNYCLIFGIGPVPALGIAGAAIASSLAEVVCLLFFTGYALTRTNHRRYALFEGLQGLTGALQMHLFRLGRWLMLQEAFAFFAWLLFFIAIEHLGEQPLAVSNIVRQLSALYFLFIHGFGSTCGAIAANLIGEGRADEVPALCRRGLWLCGISMLPLIAVSALLPAPALGIFTNLPEIIDAAIPTFYVMLGSNFIALASMYYLFVMGGMGQTKETSLASVIAAVVYVGYVGLISQLSSDVAVAWTADYVYYGVSGIVIAYFWRIGTWRTRKV